MKFDAKKARHEYITTKTSYRKLAEKYEVSQTYVATLASREGWVKDREEYRAKVYQKAMEKSEKNEVDKLAKCKTATDTAIEVLCGFIDEFQGESVGNLQKHQNFRQCVLALKDLTALQRDLNGILSKKDELALRQDEGNNGEYGIVFIPPLAAESDTVVVEGEDDE